MFLVEIYLNEQFKVSTVAQTFVLKEFELKKQTLMFLLYSLQFLQLVVAKPIDHTQFKGMKQKSNFLCKFAKICSFKTLQVVKGEITVLMQFEGIKQTNDSR